MAEIFIVQKRPAHGVSNGFYYRIVDVHTGETMNRNFLQAVQAETHCRQINEEAVKSVEKNHSVIQL